MANFYTDIPELKYHLNNPMMERICQLKERDYRDKDEFDYAPQDYADAMDSYDKILEITGEITGETIAPNAEGVDEEGPHCGNGRVEYASGTKQNLDAMVKAGLNGMTMPRRFGGLNFPITPYTMCAEIVAAADAGFGNIWSLQDCIETLYEFGNEDQHSRFIPRICAGETMSMDLTEPDAGSDLQSVMLKATFDEANNCWRLNGVKRFITNGDANLHLVLARSEEGTKDGRGLSMFIYDKNEGGVDVRRIENKLGIHGSPTCELVYKNAKAELCGDRKLGLIKYVMALMNGARLGIAAQSVGLSQAAYNEGLAYAKERKQFGKAIIDFPAVYDMLSIMKAKLDAGRALLYQTSRYVDIYKALDDIARERKLTPEERQEQKVYAKLADSFTPLSKGMNSEYANVPEYNNNHRLDTRPRATGFTTTAEEHKPLAAGVSLQYADREPRFYASVAYNGAYWYLGNEKEIADRNKQIFYYRGKRDGYNAGMFWLRTGIGVMKYVHPDDTYQNNSIDNLRYKPEPAIRYADILLMYAEAINEVSEGTYDIPSWDGAKTHSIHRSVAEMRKGIKPVRMRAGVPDFDNNIYADKDVFRIYLKRERQIELMGEGKRYYDIRRWKDARVEEAMPVYGCNTLMTESDREMFHTPIAVWNLSATFSDKMWFWPISHGELKRNKRLTQNPGWTYND